MPHFIVLYEAEDFQGESWVVQCEILEVHVLGALPADEEQVHVPNANGQPPTMISLAWVSLAKCPFICKSMPMVITM
jgi:hypothetical protein